MSASAHVPDRVEGEDEPSAKKPKIHDSSVTHLLRIRNATQLVVVCSNKERLKIGADMDKIEIIENGTLVAGMDGRIEAIGPEAEMAAKYESAVFATDIDATGKSVIPGLCDGHTHPVWAGDRCHEFAMKLAGATYMDIHAAGGGIGFTVEKTRAASEDELLALFMARLDRMLAFGTTLAEAKSGYGLEKDTEIKMLRVLHRANTAHPITVSATYCGAHSVPKGMTAAQAAEDVVSVQLPAIMELKAAGEVDPENIDVFFETGVFEVDDTRKVLEAGKAAGLNLNFHGDELSAVGAGELAGELSALAVSHLEEVTDAGIAAMAAVPSVAVLLPTTAYVLRLVPPPARKMIDQGVPVALGSDFNPNAHCLSMPHVLNLACVTMKMTMNEALVAATINSAASVAKSDEHGSLEVGKWANAVVIDHAMWEHIIYEVADPPIAAVVVKGEVVSCD